MAKAPKVEIKPGDVLGGKYRIERIIGKGGMGVVAAARHTELHQRVAIKVLPIHLASDKDLVERFMREARAAARLRSEHAVKVVDVGARPNGSPYNAPQVRPSGSRHRERLLLASGHEGRRGDCACSRMRWWNRSLHQRRRLRRHRANLQDVGLLRRHADCWGVWPDRACVSSALTGRAHG